MKKFSILLALVVTLVGSTAHAQTSSGKAAAAAKNTESDSFNWGIGVMGLAILGVVVGLTAASAASTPVSYSN